MKSVELRKQMTGEQRSYTMHGQWPVTTQAEWSWFATAH